MKREIHCNTCKELLKQKVFNKPSAPGEHVKYISGKLRYSGLICDFCGKSLEEGKEAHCLSIWADYGCIPYYEWEHEYIFREEEVKKS